MPEGISEYDRRIRYPNHVEFQKVYRRLSKITTNHRYIEAIKRDTIYCDVSYLLHGGLCITIQEVHSKQNSSLLVILFTECGLYVLLYQRDIYIPSARHYPTDQAEEGTATCRAGWQKPL